MVVLQIFLWYQSFFGLTFSIPSWLILPSLSTSWSTWLLLNSPPQIIFSGEINFSLFFNVRISLAMLMVPLQRLQSLSSLILLPLNRILNMWNDTFKINALSVSYSLCWLKKPWSKSLVSPLLVMSSLLWKIPSTIFPRLMSFTSKMICNSSSVAPKVSLNTLVHLRLYVINSLQWAARLMIPTKFTGILEDWALTLLIFLLSRCLSLYYQLSKTWFP